MLLSTAPISALFLHCLAGPAPLMWICSPNSLSSRLSHAQLTYPPSLDSSRGRFLFACLNAPPCATSWVKMPDTPLRQRTDPSYCLSHVSEVILPFTSSLPCSCWEAGAYLLSFLTPGAWNRSWHSLCQQICFEKLAMVMYLCWDM